MVSKVFDVKTNSYEDALAFFEESLEKMGVPMKYAMSLPVVFEEVYVNIQNYAYAEDAVKTIVEISVDYASTGLFYMEFRDFGIAFNPLERKDPDVTLSAEERSVGGLGIFMVKRMMDTVDYKRDGEENVLRLVKKL